MVLTTNFHNPQCGAIFFLLFSDFATNQDCLRHKTVFNIVCTKQNDHPILSAKSNCQSRIFKLYLIFLTLSLSKEYSFWKTKILANFLFNKVTYGKNRKIPFWLFPKRFDFWHTDSWQRLFSLNNVGKKSLPAFLMPWKFSIYN